MAEGKYRLQSVLDVRGRAKQEAARVVALRRAELADAEEELARRERALAECRERQRDAQERVWRGAERGAEARRVVAHRTHLADLREQEQALAASVEAQRAAVARAGELFDGALARLAEAQKELRVVETHRENWRDEERRAAARREQKAGDELGADIHRQKRQK